MVIGLPTLE